MMNCLNDPCAQDDMSDVSRDPNIDLPTKFAGTKDEESPLLNALAATSFPFVAWIFSGLPIWWFSPTIALAAIAWFIALSHIISECIQKHCKKTTKRHFGRKLHR